MNEKNIEHFQNTEKETFLPYEENPYYYTGGRLISEEAKIRKLGKPAIEALHDTNKHQEHDSKINEKTPSRVNSKQ